MFDIIVFKQEGLTNALKDGYTRIGLCDNTFVLPPVKASYTAIGTVVASVEATKEESDRLKIEFDGFIPTFSDKPAADISSVSVSSYISSYFLSSYFMSSYMYAYETSYRTSYTTSYTTSYSTSYTTSYSTSYSTSYNECFGMSAVPVRDEGERVCVMVNGYGINLI